MYGVFQWIVCLIVLVNRGFAQEAPLFFSQPPDDDYYRRSNMKDCPKRFYEGRKNPEIIVTGYGYGGTRALRGEFQHMLALGWTRPSGKIDYICGGSLITAVFILTAAHCSVDHENNPPDTVRIDDTDLGSPEDDEFAQQIAILGITVHPQYRGSRKYFDIALIELAQPAKFSETVCAACLWHEEELPGERMDAVGFGVTGFGEDLSPTLQRVQLDRIGVTRCSERLAINRRQMPEGLRDDQFCAAGNNMDTCEGDSGGPIGVKRLDVGGDIISLIVGIVSFGTPCTPGSMGVYTRVATYIDWLERETNTSLSYAACTKGIYCPGRLKNQTSVRFERGVYRTRYGLIWDMEEPSEFECGATLIDYQFLLTSAHCVTARREYPKYVHLDSDIGTERVAITDVYVAPRYRPGRPENDIALVKIKKFINADYFRPACLWDRRILGEWSGNPMFRAYGPFARNTDPLLLANRTITIRNWNGRNCRITNDPASDLVCYNNNVNIMPGVCSIDYGASVVNGSEWMTPVYSLGVVSALAKDCGSNLIVTDITPHIDWIEAIIVGRRDRVHIFSD